MRIARWCAASTSASPSLAPRATVAKLHLSRHPSKYNRSLTTLLSSSAAAPPPSSPSSSSPILRLTPNRHRRWFSSQSKTIFKCSSCQKETLKWAGQCPQCKSWNTLEEVTVTAPPASAQVAKAERERQKWIGDQGEAAQISSAADHAKQAESHRIQFVDPELKRVFGGGLVLGSVVLLAGTPGVGKSKSYRAFQGIEGLRD